MPPNHSVDGHLALYMSWSEMKTFHKSPVSKTCTMSCISDTSPVQSRRSTSFHTPPEVEHVQLLQHYETIEILWTIWASKQNRTYTNIYKIYTAKQMQYFVNKILAKLKSTFSITSRATVMGLAMLRIHATPPALRVEPSIILASISISPSVVRHEPLPAETILSNTTPHLIRTDGLYTALCKWCPQNSNQIPWKHYRHSNITAKKSIMPPVLHKQITYITGWTVVQAMC